MRPWRGIAVLMLSVLASACTNEAEFGATKTENLQPYHTGWQYRFGDSPRDESGKLAWLAEPLEGASGWTEQPFPDWVPSRPGPQHVWQRNVLPELPPDQTLMILGAWQLFEVYVDGEQVYRFGRVDDPKRQVFPGRAWHWLDLKPEWSGKVIAFRFYSSDHYVGLYDGAYLGTRGDHILWLFKRDMPVLIMGSLYIFLGVVMIFLFTRNRREIVNYSFGAFAFSIGIYEICRTNVKHFLFHDPMLWGNIELTALFFLPTMFCLFAEHVIGAGPFKLVRRIWQFNTLFLLVVHLRHLVLDATLWSAVYLFQKWFLGAAVVVLFLIGRAAFVGNTEARFFFGGASVVVIAAIHDILASMGVIQALGIINHLGMFVLISCLALIVGRRYFLTAALARNIELASAVQNLLLPSQRQGRFGPFEFSSYYQPHDRMSGDWINFWQAESGERRLIFGDVVGKGPRAALAVAAIAALIESAKEAGDDLSQCIARIDSGLSKLFGGHVTTTLTALIMHDDGRLHLYNCGGMGWLRWRDGQSDHIAMPSSVLGMGGNAKMAQRAFELAEGEYLVSFTDGVADGSRAIMRLTQALRQAKDKIETIEDLIDIAAHLGVKVVQDDRSIVAVRHAPAVAALPESA
jgi:hypothetical protein